MNIKKKLKVFEAFAGIGAQAAVLKRMNIDYEIVGISDWFIDAIICYDAIHRSTNEHDSLPDKTEQLKYLENFEFSKDSVQPANLKTLKNSELEDLYIANRRSKNYGSITQITGEELPDIDLLVYSFPCQDLSTGGKGLGMKKGSGTRSGLLKSLKKLTLI